MSNTSLIVKKQATKKSTKKTTQKEYLFCKDVWRIIMSYVGTPEQYVDRLYNQYSARPTYYTGILTRVIPTAPYWSYIGTPITPYQYENDGFRLQQQAGLLIDVKPLLRRETLYRIRWDIGQYAPMFNRYTRRILKVLVKQPTHPTYIDNSDFKMTNDYGRYVITGGDFIVLFSNRRYR